LKTDIALTKVIIVKNVNSASALPIDQKLISNAHVGFLVTRYLLTVSA
jgi:hypothetical protein